MKHNAVISAIIITFSLAGPVSAQETSAPASQVDGLEEIITYGQQNWGSHDGMKAFFDGDYKRAEIEFEREFLSLRRIESAKRNAIDDAANGILRAESSATASSSNGVVVSGPGGSVQVGPSGGTSVNSSVAGTFRNKHATGKSILTDGKVTYEDFAFSRYMSGLSEIKLGKFAEAKKSLIQSLNYNVKNYDARMRLGLLHVQESNYEDAATQLEKLDKIRKSCNRRSCEDKDRIREATIILANAIRNSAAGQ